MRTISAALEDACLTGTGLPTLSATLTPFRFPRRMTDIGTIDVCRQADMSATHIVRVRYSTVNVQVNRIARSAIPSASAWGSWTTIATEGTNITFAAIFCTGARVTVLWMKTGNTNVFQKVSTDNGATFGSTTTVISTADTVTNLRGMPQAGFLHWNDTAGTGYIYAYDGAGSYVVSEIPFPASPGADPVFEGSIRTFTDADGTSRTVITVAAKIVLDAALFHHQLWIGSAYNYLTTAVWTSRTTYETSSELQGFGAISGVFEEFIMINLANSDILCKLTGYTELTYGYRPKDTQTFGIMCGWNNTYTQMVFDQGLYAANIKASSITYEVVDYQVTKDSMTCILNGSEPDFGILVLSRGYNSETEPLPPFLVRSWKELRSGFYQVKAVSGKAALAGTPTPPGLYIQDNIGNALKAIFGVVGLVVSVNNETLLTGVTPFPNGLPTFSTLSAAYGALSHSGSIEIFLTEYGVKAIATLSTTSSQEITPDREILESESYSSYRGLLPYTGDDYNADPFDNEAMPFIPQLTSYPYQPTSYTAPIYNMNKESENEGTYQSRINVSLEENDVIGLAIGDFRITAIDEGYQHGKGYYMQTVHFRGTS